MFVTLTDAFLEIDGFRFDAPAPLRRFSDVFKSSYRVVDAPTPAPYGYRNNMRYVFDSLGVSLLDDHSTPEIIGAISFVFFRPRNARYPVRFPTEPFGGAISFGDIGLTPDMTPVKLLKSGIPGIRQHWKTHYYIDCPALSIHFTFSRPQGDAKKRYTTPRLAEISCGFRKESEVRV